MRLEKGAKIAGIDARVVRDALRYGGDRFYPHRIAKKLRCPVPEAQALLERMEQEGLVERVRVDEDGDVEWQPTPAGGRLRTARALSPLRRTTAERLLAEVIERAKALNREAASPWYVSRVGVFGSFVTSDAEQLGDLDLALDVPDRPGYPRCTYDVFWEMDAWFKLLRIIGGRSGYVQEMSWARVPQGVKPRVVFAAKRVPRWRRDDAWALMLRVR